MSDQSKDANDAARDADGLEYYEASSGLLDRRFFLGGAASLALLAAIGIELTEAEPTSAFVPGYNLPFTNLSEPGTVIPLYDHNDGWHTRAGGGHHGIDFSNYGAGGPIAGRKVYPIRSGVVSALDYDPTKTNTQLGNVVTVTHSDGMVSKYCHLASYVVSLGAAVNPATLLGFIGNTGSASDGPHLHLAMHPSAVAHDIDPWPYLNGAPYANNVGATTPIQEEEKVARYIIRSSDGSQAIMGETFWHDYGDENRAKIAAKLLCPNQVSGGVAIPIALNDHEFQINREEYLTRMAIMKSALGL